MNSKEKERIRNLAYRLAEIADKPEMEERRELWKKHNSLKKTRPLVLIYPEGSWREILPYSSLECQDPQACAIEWQLKARIYRFEHFNDDMVIEKTWVVPKRITSTGWGVEVNRDGSATEFMNTWAMLTNIGGVPRVWDPKVHLATEAGKFEPVIKTPDDLAKLRKPEIGYDKRGTEEDLAAVNDLVGDILDVQTRGRDHITYHLMLEYTEMRGLTEMMMDMYDNPTMLHEAMEILTQGHRAMLRQFQELDLLDLNNNETYHGTGGVGYTDELPQTDGGGSQCENRRVRPADMWGAAEAQETAQVSPEQWAEFVLPYEKCLLAPFGLTGYGCCEDLSRRIEYLYEVPNLRRVSVSPFADVDVCAEKLKGDYIFSWKPKPSMLVGKFDEKEIRRYIQHTLDVTGDCRVEMILKDLHTIENEPERLTRWTDIARELADG